MADDLEYTLTRPPSCPTNRDHIHLIVWSEVLLPHPGGDELPSASCRLFRELFVLLDHRYRPA